MEHLHRFGNPERGVGLGLLRDTLFVTAQHRGITIIKHIISHWSTRNFLYSLASVFVVFHVWKAFESLWMPTNLDPAEGREL